MFARTTSLYLKLLGCLIVGGTAAAGVTAAASAGASPPIVATALGAGTLKTPVTLKAKAGAMAVEVIKVAPGGDFGWHTHGSAVAVVITAGTLTVWIRRSQHALLSSIPRERRLSNLLTIFIGHETMARSR